MLADVLFRTEPPHQGPRGIEPAALELGDRPPAHLVRAVAEELLRPRAPVRDATPHVGRDDSCRRMLRDGAEEVPGSARLLGEPRAPDRERGLTDDPLEKLPVVGVEVERRLSVQREHAEERALVDDRHDVGAAEAVLPEPVHREDASVREDVRDHDRLAVRGDPARQAVAEPDPAPGVRRGEVLYGEGARIERPRGLVGDPEPDRWRLHQLRSRARDLAEHVVEVRGGRDDAREPDENLEAGKLPVGRLLELAEPCELGLRGLQAEGLTARPVVRSRRSRRVMRTGSGGRLRKPAPCIRSAGTGMRRRPPPRGRRRGSSRPARHPRGSCRPSARSRLT